MSESKIFFDFEFVCVSVLRDVAVVDWNVRTNYSWYPLTLAEYYGCADILQIILTVPEPNLDLIVTDDRGRNIAQIAVEENGVDRQRCVELLSGDRRVNLLLHGLTETPPWTFYVLEFPSQQSNNPSVCTTFKQHKITFVD